MQDRSKILFLPLKVRNKVATNIGPSRKQDPRTPSSTTRKKYSSKFFKLNFNLFIKKEKALFVCSIEKIRMTSKFENYLFKKLSFSGLHVSG